MEAQAKEGDSLEKRPGIFFLGSPGVGKRSLISRLLGLDFDDASDSSSSSSQLVVNGWNISTKYYTADVSVWMAHLHDEFSIETLPMYDQLAALILVFDTTELASLSALQKWVSRTDLQKFDILVCVGNKVDLVPGHPVHAEYRRQLQKLGDPFADDGPAFTVYGISEAEGSSLLGNDEPPGEARHTCLEWCTEHNIEFVEACASNADFDKCLSVDGDSQGIERIFGALSAHMWPGMILKSGDKIAEPSLPERGEDLSDEESDYEFEYEVLSAGSADPFDDTEEWVSANVFAGPSDMRGLAAQSNLVLKCKEENGTSCGKQEPHASTSTAALDDGINKGGVSNAEKPDQDTELDQAQEPDEGSNVEFEDLEQLMSEIGNMRDSLRLMPDFQRRDMAAKLAMKMATMFGGGSDDEVESIGE
ncbi:hypothetical protein ACFX13_018467 [Malus domestica]|uniref:Uncharacterized protein n=1 Tax=Malus domestica TaxID=3750 RepID=A0A498HZ57_MALDO|nr:uncharacterized protein LOC103442624 [Malus domestica]RXH74887.1 hypothetical protein DVH24_029608 [Malus domestica]